MFKKASLIMTVVIILAAFQSVRCTAEDDWDDVMIADFSDCATADEWKGDPTTYIHSDNMQSEVTRIGREYALKWCDEDGYARLRGSAATKFDNISRLLNGYLNVWIYSTSNGGQRIDLAIYDSVTNKNKSIQKAIELNWTGWKLCSIDISASGYKVSDFDGAKTAQDTDKATIHLQHSNGTPRSGVVTYIDSIWLSQKKPLNFDSSSELITPSIINNMCDVNPNVKQFTFTANQLLKLEANYYDDKITVCCDGIELLCGSDYIVEHENNIIYITFQQDLTDGSQYRIILNKDAELNSGKTIGKDTDVLFTVNAPELSTDGYSFWCDDEEIFTPPLSGTVKVELNARSNFAECQAMMIVGVYRKSDNRMICAPGMSEILTVETTQSQHFEAEVTAESFKDCYIRAFLWNNEDDMYSFTEYGEINEDLL